MLRLVTGLFQQTLTEPRKAVRQALEVTGSVPVLVLAGILSILISVLGTQLGIMISGAELPTDMNPLVFLISNPMALAVFYVVLYWLSLVLAIRVGAAFGGVGSSVEVTAAVTVFHVVAMVVNLAEVILVILAPGVAGFLSVISVSWLLYVAGVFLDEVHRFGNVTGVVVGIIASVIACILVFSLALALLMAVF